MKINDLLEKFEIFQTNEEKEVMSRLDGVMSLDSFTERDQAIIENLIRKSLVSKVHKNGSILVMANEL
jgi:hypothetical protein